MGMAHTNTAADREATVGMGTMAGVMEVMEVMEAEGATEEEVGAAEGGVAEAEIEGGRS